MVSWSLNASGWWIQWVQGRNLNLCWRFRDTVKETPLILAIVGFTTPNNQPPHEGLDYNYLKFSLPSKYNQRVHGSFPEVLWWDGVVKANSVSVQTQEKVSPHLKGETDKWIGVAYTVMWMKCISFMVTRECRVDLGQLFCPFLLMESFADRHLQIVAV